MIRSLIGLWRLVCTALHVLHGLAIVYWRFGALDVAARRQRIRWWSGKLLRLLGIELLVHGQPRSAGTLLVANHVSWLDIIAIHAVCPHARFVSKAEVRHWPLLGRLVEAGGTLFIEREKKRDAMRVVHHMAAALRAGDTVAVFPEGTTGDGGALLPFHANLLEAAIVTGHPVQPVALRYSDAAASISPAAAYIGDMSLLGSLLAVARARGLRVRVALLSAEGTRHADRRALAAHLREQIDAELSR